MIHEGAGPAPVVISHFDGCPPYLRHALRTARRHNPRVVLLGDRSNVERWPDSVDCADWDTVPYAAFRRVFQKLSFYADDYERAFWRRLFMLEAWMSDGHHASAVLLDSDVVTFADFSQAMAPFLADGCDVGLMTPHEQENYLWASSCHVSYWSLTALREFLDFCIATYEQAPRREVLEEKWRWHQATQTLGGVCEMTLLYLWARSRARVANFTQVVGGATFDHNLNDAANYWPGEYATSAGRKTIRFANGRPYAMNLRTQQRVTFHTLHCQADAKRLMGLFANPLTQPWWQYEWLALRGRAALRGPWHVVRSLLPRWR